MRRFLGSGIAAADSLLPAASFLLLLGVAGCGSDSPAGSGAAGSGATSSGGSSGATGGSTGGTSGSSASGGAGPSGASSAGGPSEGGSSAGGSSAGGSTSTGAAGSSAGGANAGGSSTGGSHAGGAGGAAGSGGAGGSKGMTSTCDWRNSAPVTVKTPFSAPDNTLTFTPPTIPCLIFKITDFGAKADGTTLNSAAIASTIAAAEAAGGGVVDVPSGTFETGAIHLASNLDLHLEAGAILKFSGKTADYLPLVLTRWEGLDVLNWSPMIYALSAINVAITGTGTLQGPGLDWENGITAWKTGATTEDANLYAAWTDAKAAALTGPPSAAQVPTSGKVNGLRPTFVECNNCTNFMYDGPTLTKSVYWAIHPVYSKNVIIRNATVDTKTDSVSSSTPPDSVSNGDGTDPDSCENTLIDNMTYNTTDDIVAVKSGLNEVGIAVNRPTHNLVARNIKAKSGHGFSIGSEMSGSVDNVYLTSDTPEVWSDLQYILRIKTLKGRGGVISKVFLDNASGTPTINSIYLTTAYAAGTIAPRNPALYIPEIRDITLSNVAMSPGGVFLQGLVEKALSNINFVNVHVTGVATCNYVNGLNIDAASSIEGLDKSLTTCGATTP